MEIRELAESDLAELLSLYKHLHVADEPAPSRAESSQARPGQG